LLGLLNKNGKYFSAFDSSVRGNSKTYSRVSFALLHYKSKKVPFFLQNSLFLSEKSQKKFSQRTTVRYGSVRFNSETLQYLSMKHLNLKVSKRDVFFPIALIKHK